MLISLNSAVSVPIAKLAEEHEIPLIASLVVANDFTNSPYTFRHYTTAKSDAEKAIAFLEKQKAQRVAVIYIENEYGQSARDQFKQIYKGELVAIESFDSSETDFSTILLKIKESKADWIYLLGYPAHNMNILDQKRELGINISVVGNSPLTETTVVQHMKDTDEVFYGTNFLGADTGLPKPQRFIEKFENRFGRKPDLAAFGYDLVLIADAVQKSGKDSLIALNEVEVDGVNGVLTFDDAGDSNPENIMYKVEKGTLTRID